MASATFTLTPATTTWASSLLMRPVSTAKTTGPTRKSTSKSGWKGCLKGCPDTHRGQRVWTRVARHPRLRLHHLLARGRRGHRARRTPHLRLRPDRFRPFGRLDSREGEGGVDGARPLLRYH